VKDNNNSTAKIYFEMTSGKKWYVTSCVFAIFNALLFVGFAIAGIANCDAPKVNGIP
jgi:hypothetical protein